MLRTTSCLAVLAFVAALHSGDGKVYAEEIYYVGPDGGSWHTQGNWSLGRVPAEGDGVRIFDDLTVRITANADAGSLTVGYIRDGGVIQESGNIGVGSIVLGRTEGTHENRGTYILNGGSIDGGGSLLVGRSNRDNSFIMNGGTIDKVSLSIGTAHHYLGFDIPIRSTGDNSFIMNGGTIDTDYLLIGKDSIGDNRFIMNDGDVKVRDLRIGRAFGTGPGAGAFRQKSGTVLLSSSALWLEGETAVYNLEGGTLTLPTGIAFGSRSTDIYFNFDGGVMNLPGEWDFERLVTIPDSDFRAFGNPATEADMEFSDLFFIGSEVYTAISAIPEPSTLALLSMGALALTIGWWRRRRKA